MSWVHKEFQLNTHSFSNKEELISFSKGISSSLHHFLTGWFSESEVVTVKTSGSTGKPKNIELSKEHMKNSAFATGRFFEVHEKTKALCCLPIDFIAGKMMVVRAMILGWHLDVMEPSSTPLETLEKKYDFSAMVPLQLSNSLSKIHLIGQLIVGGGVVPAQLEESIQNLSTKIYATYGMTETITHVAVKPLNNSCHSELVSESHYKTLSNVSISTDERNCLVINAPKVSDELIVTNDVVEMISTNEFIWKGRYDNVINSGGVKLYPEEIEKKLSSHIQIRFFAIGVPDKKLGEKLVLVVEGANDPNILNEVRNLKVLGKYETPKEVFFVSQFKETPTGKIQRRETLEVVL